MSTSSIDMISNLNLKKIKWKIPNWLLDTNQMVKVLAVPLIAIVVFLVLWGSIASQIKTSLGQVPGPSKVWEQTLALYDEHVEERNKEEAFYERQEKRNAKKLAKDPQAKVKIRSYTGKPTFID